MASKSEYLNVSPEKLRRCIEARGLNLNQAAQTCGCGSALHNAMNRGILAKPITYALLNELGIRYEDYAADEIHIDDQKDQFEITEEVWERLEEVIISAVKKALNE